MPPRDLHQEPDPTKRQFLDQLPQLLRGYGKSLGDYAAAIVVVDLDDRNCVDFKKELPKVLDACDPGPTILFRTAIKESEAWVLGDCAAVKAAYPRVKEDTSNQGGLKKIEFNASRPLPSRLPP